jgi:hypothetical protein
MTVVWWILRSSVELRLQLWLDTVKPPVVRSTSFSSQISYGGGLTCWEVGALAQRWWPRDLVRSGGDPQTQWLRHFRRGGSGGEVTIR